LKTIFFNYKMKSAVIFGSSSSRILTILDNVKVNTYKGKSILGLLKDDIIKKDIIEKVKHYKDKKCLFFWFGTVDLTSIFYYKIIYKNEYFDFEPLIKRYVKFIADLKTDSKKIIFVPSYPTWETKEEIIGGVLNYGTVLKLKDIKTEHKKFLTRKILLENYNLIKNTLIKECKKYKIRLINIESILKNKNGKIKKKYKNPFNKYSVHIVWEEIIEELVVLINDCGIHKKNIKINWKEYEKWIKYRKIKEKEKKRKKIYQISDYILF